MRGLLRALGTLSGAFTGKETTKEQHPTGGTANGTTPGSGLDKRADTKEVETSGPPGHVCGSSDVPPQPSCNDSRHPREFERRCRRRAAKMARHPEVRDTSDLYRNTGVGARAALNPVAIRSYNELCAMILKYRRKLQIRSHQVGELRKQLHDLNTPLLEHVRELERKNVQLQIATDRQVAYSDMLAQQLADLSTAYQNLLTKKEET